MESQNCPRCGKSCPVRAHNSAHCSACFTSFRADAPESILTASERIRKARRAWQVSTYEREGYPLPLVRKLNRQPESTLDEVLDWYSEQCEAVA